MTTKSITYQKKEKQILPKIFLRDWLTQDIQEELMPDKKKF